MDIVETDGLYLVDGRWFLPTDKPVLVERALARVSASVASPFVRPRESVDERFIELIRPGDVVIDVGATTGEYAIGAARRARTVHAVEPSPGKYACLRRNMELHRVANVRPHHRLLSDVSTDLVLHEDDERIFGDSVHGGPPGGRTIPMRSVTLDDFAREAGIGAVDLLKVTVNGHEPAVLRGGRTLLSRTSRVLFQSAHHEEALAILRECGFEVRRRIDSCVHALLGRETRIVLAERRGVPEAAPT